MSSLANIQANEPHHMATIASSGQNLAVSTSVVQLAAAAVPEKTKMVEIQPVGASVRFTTDGQDPSASFGKLLADGVIYRMSLRNALAAKFIRSALTDAVLHSEALTY